MVTLCGGCYDAHVPAIAFFDVDRTVISANSVSLWIRRGVRQGHISWWHALQGVLWLALYALGIARLEEAITDAAKRVRGQRESDLRERTYAFWREEVAPLVQPGARRTIALHRARGDRVVLLTTASVWMCEAIAAELGCDDYLCNRMGSENGLLNGVLEPPLCYGDGKRLQAAALAESLGVPLSECSYYGDSFSDLPILLAVGFPVVVNPDPRLRRVARQRGWRVEDWSRPE